MKYRGGGGDEDEHNTEYKQYLENVRRDQAARDAHNAAVAAARAAAAAAGKK